VACDFALGYRRLSRLAKSRSHSAQAGNYFDDENVFQQWLDEECNVEPGNPWKTATSGVLFTSWSVYAKDAGSLPSSKARFGENLEQARSTGGVRTWRGIQIRRPFLHGDAH
jgi:putative DNA primase/helicase